MEKRLKPSNMLVFLEVFELFGDEIGVLSKDLSRAVRSYGLELSIEELRDMMAYCDGSGNGEAVDTWICCRLFT